MRSSKNHHTRIYIRQSESYGILPIFITFLIVTPLDGCWDESSHVTIDCVYIKAEGILCTWDWKNHTSMEYQGGNNTTATVLLNSSVGTQPQICVGQDANTPCRFHNDFDASTMFFVTALVNNSRAGGMYKTCKMFNLLTTVRYEKPRQVTFYHSWWGGWMTDVVWQFPLDYPTAQGVMKTWSVCKVRWSENLGPWEERQISTDNYMSIRNIRPLSTYNVQVTCLSLYSRRENWTSNKTFTTPGKTDGIDHEPDSDVTQSHSTVTWVRTVSVVTLKPGQHYMYKSTTVESSSDSQETSRLPTTTDITSTAVQAKANAATLPLGVFGPVLLLLAVLVGGFIFTRRRRKTRKEDNNLSPGEEILKLQASDISRCVSKQQLLENASHVV